MSDHHCHTPESRKRRESGNSRGRVGKGQRESGNSRGKVGKGKRDSRGRMETAGGEWGRGRDSGVGEEGQWSGGRGTVEWGKKDSGVGEEGQWSGGKRDSGVGEEGQWSGRETAEEEKRKKRKGVGWGVVGYLPPQFDSQGCCTPLHRPLPRYLRSG
jgi:hypothetical protein